ncbi:hypothetical protein I0C86_41275 [Plantactinospora sp. S1510]|uniref:Uncharacterized protein n=1 Tax=Plantactinospora alkalitolerans TaxID=2789879 RepID=A0ABS0HA33_9ACTN|nr:hypothetical protein [Plantactinospora alkalitolerans]MBF9135285.1 hypothetical protein [Plantactinospora alkalitolerans]
MIHNEIRPELADRPSRYLPGRTVADAARGALASVLDQLDNPEPGVVGVAHCGAEDRLDHGRPVRVFVTDSSPAVSVVFLLKAGEPTPAARLEYSEGDGPVAVPVPDGRIAPLYAALWRYGR